jgi:hypothetical protein
LLYTVRAMTESEPQAEATEAPVELAPEAKPEPEPTGLSRWLRPDSTSRRRLLALGMYAFCVAIFAAIAGPSRLLEHTAFNHYALLADAWVHGRQWIVHGGPDYAQGNDFAEFAGKTYISFPPFPALLMLPFVALAGSPENFQDGQFVMWLAGVGPAALFLVLEKLRRTGRSERTEQENAVFALLFAFGTVYFFTAVEGTVWFAALVVGVGVQAVYLLLAMDAERPLLAGLALGCAFMTRPTTILLGGYYALEAYRVSAADPYGTAASADAPFLDRVAESWKSVDREALARRILLFAAPVAATLILAATMNHARFGTWNPNAFGHEYLTVQWRGRMDKWGLFGWHYLAKNLGVSLTILPWMPPAGQFCFDMPREGLAAVVTSFLRCVPFRVNEHGLALWWTTPLYFWLLAPVGFAGAPRARRWQYIALGIWAGIIAAMDLLYQNSGWRQFGFRFSNDFAVVLFILLALGGRSTKSRWFQVAAAWGIAWNLFGAVTFDRAAWDHFYFREGTQQILYQAD